MSIFMYFLCLILLLFSLLNFDFTIFTFWYSIKCLENINWEVLLLTKLTKPCLPWNFLLWVSAVNNGRSVVNHLWPLTAHIYHVMITVAMGFSQKPLYLLFPRNSFTCCFVIIFCITAFHLFVLFHSLQTYRMCLFSFCLSFCNHSLALSHFLYFLHQ